jgi:hypothetical protein
MDLKTGKSRALTQDWDRSASSLAFTPDSKALIVTAEDVLDTPAFRVDLASGQATRLSFQKGREGHVSQIIPLKGGAFLLKRDAVDAAPELYLGKPWQAGPAADRSGCQRWPAWPRSRSSGSLSRGPTAIRSGARSSSRRVPPASCPPCCLSMAGRRARSAIAGPSLEPAPLGGAWLCRVTIDFHGSTGYGQAFTDEHQPTGAASRLRISSSASRRRRTGSAPRSGQCLRAGGSYGGYMMNWIEGSGPMVQVHHPARRCLRRARHGL